MTRLIWENLRDYEMGLDRGVFYPKNGSGEVWNGLVSVSESSSDDLVTRYMDGVNTHIRRRPEDFSGTIEAFTYPESDVFYGDIFQSRPKPFGLSYRISTANRYKIHLVYNVLLSPASFDYQQTETAPFSWEFTTRPVDIPGAKPSAHLIVDVDKAYSSVTEELEEILYGNETDPARLPSPEEVLNIFEEHAILQVIDHGDGTFTVIGPDSAIQMIDETTFKINWPSVIYIDSVTYKVSSL